MPIAADAPLPYEDSGAHKPATTNGGSFHSKLQSIGTEPDTADRCLVPNSSSLPYRSTRYPSNSLKFLEDLERQPHPTAAEQFCRPAQLKLDIIVVGAGLGGLAAAVALARRGHKVTVLEQAAQLAEVGAGIQIPPNSVKLLQRWGVIDGMKDQVVRPDTISFRRWSSGACIGLTDLSDSFSKTYGAPYYVAHRAHLHSALVQRARSLGVAIRLGSRVVSYDTAAPSVALDDGCILEGDLVVGADGIKSIARDSVCGGPRRNPQPTGYAVYRATVDVGKMREIPETSWLLERSGLNIWIGENRHVMTYTIASGEAFNMVLSHKESRDPSAWQNMSQSDILLEMRNNFKGWDKDLLKVISLIEHTTKWPLIGNNFLESWASNSSTLVVLGDAAHSMVPYMSQGAAMAVEDGAALAVALNSIRSVNKMKFAIDVFQAERKTRSSMMQEASMVNAMIWHFADGPEQRARDEAMRPEVEGRLFHSSPNQWSDPLTQNWVYGYDAEEKMEEEWELAVHKAILEVSGPR